MNIASDDRALRDRILTPYVKYICSVDAGDFHSGASVLPYFADGMPGLIFHQCDGPLFLNESKKLDPIFLYGQTVEPITISTPGRLRMTIVYFYPDVVQQLFGLPAHEITDSCVDLTLLRLNPGYPIQQLLDDAPTDESREEILKEFIFKLIVLRGFPLNKEIRYATSMITHSRGATKMRDLASELQISERTLTRHFEQHVGVAPKLFSNICRFRSAINRIQRGQVDSLSGLAADLGYSDQSHFNREFKKFSRVTPLDFLNNQTQSF